MEKDFVASKFLVESIKTSFKKFQITTNRDNNLFAFIYSLNISIFVTENFSYKLVFRKLDEQRNIRNFMVSRKVEANV